MNFDSFSLFKIVLGLSVSSLVLANDATTASETSRLLDYRKNHSVSFSVLKEAIVEIDISLVTGFITVIPSMDDNISFEATSLSKASVNLIEKKIVNSGSVKLSLTTEVSHENLNTINNTYTSPDENWTSTPVLLEFAGGIKFLGTPEHLPKDYTLETEEFFPGTVNLTIKVPNSALQKLKLNLVDGYIKVEGFSPTSTAMNRSLFIQHRGTGKIELFGNYSPGGIEVRSNSGAETSLQGNQGKVFIFTKSKISARNNIGRFQILLPQEYKGNEQIKVSNHAGEVTLHWIRDPKTFIWENPFEIEASLGFFRFSSAPEDQITYEKSFKKCETSLLKQHRE